MTRSQTRTYLLFLLLALVLTAQVAYAQQHIRQVTLEEALALFARNNLELELARSSAEEMEALARQASAYPNPSLNVTHEPLYNDGLTQSESYVNLSQRLEWPGLRQARYEAAEGLARATEAQLRADSLRLAFEVARTFVEAAAAHDRLGDLRTVTEMFRQADQASEAQYASGEISGYDLRRLRVERARYENRLALAELDARAARRQLALLILPEEDVVEVMPAAESEAAIPRLALQVVLEQALAERAEVTRARAEVEAARAAVQVARKEWLPDPTVTAGYKRQSDGFQGVFLGASVPLPVFDRNRGLVDARQARLDAAQTRLLLAERQVENDVRRAYQAYASLAERVERISGDLLTEVDELLQAARRSYDEGEMTLVELLDAAEAYQDARSTTTELVADYQVAYFDLLRAAGRTPGSPIQQTN